MEHKLLLELPKLTQLGITDLKIKVKGNNEIIGTLAISKGAIEWRPKNEKIPYKMRWDKFDDIIRNNARKKKNK